MRAKCRSFLEYPFSTAEIACVLSTFATSEIGSRHPHSKASMSSIIGMPSCLTALLRATVSASPVAEADDVCFRTAQLIGHLFPELSQTSSKNMPLVDRVDAASPPGNPAWLHLPLRAPSDAPQKEPSEIPRDLPHIRNGSFKSPR